MTDMKNVELNWDDVPKGWALCYNGECPMREECLRWQAGQAAPGDLSAAWCVTPRALKGGGCLHFVAPEKVMVAYGFSSIYDRVLKADFTALRKQMTSMLSGKRYYYEYKRGERPLSPQQQEQIRGLFAKYGYADAVRFDRYEEKFVFPFP